MLRETSYALQNAVQKGEIGGKRYKWFYPNHHPLLWTLSSLQTTFKIFYVITKKNARREVSLEKKITKRAKDIRRKTRAYSA
jgi:hypothetical protein